MLRSSRKAVDHLIVGGLAAFAICVFTAPSAAQTTARALGFDTTNFDRSVRPQDDFFRFVNGGWLKRTEIWRTKFRDESLRNQLLTNPHSPGMYRAFVPLVNNDAFDRAFNVQSGDKMYLAPGDRVKIW